MRQTRPSRQIKQRSELAAKQSPERIIRGAGGDDEGKKKKEENEEEKMHVQRRWVCVCGSGNPRPLALQW